MKEYYRLLQEHRSENPDRFGIADPEFDAIIANVADRKRFEETVPGSLQGGDYGRAYAARPKAGADGSSPGNPLRERFERWDGAGIHKWDHYLDAYWRHLERFAGTDVNLLEIGVYSGGSLGLWESFFGNKSTIHGLDIEEECRRFEGPRTKIHIGDQGDRQYWAAFKKGVPKFDIVIDDGGHFPHQQRISLEELLPHMNPGGVYICEDIHHNHNSFLAYASGLMSELFIFQREPGDQLRSRRTAFQAAVGSMSFYPYMLVVEMNPHDSGDLRAVKKGAEWVEFSARGQKGK